jgi:hypothetical protein
VANYYLRNQPDALTECRGDGCSYPMSSCAKLESHHLHSINDGIISARDWRHAMPAFKGECEVLPPWDGKLGHLDHALHLLPSPSACTQSDEAERLLCDALTAAALASAASHEVLLTVVDASTVDSLSHLLKSLAAAKVHVWEGYPQSHMDRGRMAHDSVPGKFAVVNHAGNARASRPPITSEFESGRATEHGSDPLRTRRR